MLIGREPWKYSGRTPEFFTGQAGCFCDCPATSYHIRQYEHDSTVPVLAQVTDNRVCRGLRWDGTSLVAQYESGTGPYLRSKTYDVALADVVSINHGYTRSNTSVAAGARQSFLCANGKYAMTATRTTATNRHAVLMDENDDSLAWETNLDAPASGSVTLYAIVADSSSNVYAAAVESAAANITYKFDSSGVKQWKSTASGPTPRWMDIASDGYIWTCGSIGKIIRCSDAGTSSVFTLTGNDWYRMQPDSSGGMWIAGSASGTLSIKNVNSSGSVVTTITESLMWNNGSSLCVDSSDNVYVIIRTASPDFEYKIRKWNSSGTLQWTSDVIGWPYNGGAGGSPYYMELDADYIFVGGDWVA
jgi:hypothetical protein